MNFIRYCLAITVLMSALGLCAACTSDDDDAADDGDLEAPSITLDSVTPLADTLAQFEIAVTANDNVGVALVELLLDGEVMTSADTAPFLLTWDASASSYGPADLTVRATDAAGNLAESEAHPFEHVELDEGAEGTMVIPDDYDGTQETHVRHHWTTDEEPAARYVAFVAWEPDADQSPWVMTLEMGTGFCPHTGTTYDTAAPDDESPVLLVSAPEDGFPATTQLFAHIGANASAHVGEELPLTFHVFAF